MSNCIDCGNTVKINDLPDRSDFYIFMESGRCPVCTDSSLDGLKTLLDHISRNSLN